MRLEERNTLLSEWPRSVGARWAQGWCDDMRKEGRRVAGGWPGTLPEARAQVRAYFNVELARRGLPLMSPEEFSAATHATYENAKRAWLDVHVAKGLRPNRARRLRRDREQAG